MDIDEQGNVAPVTPSQPRVKVRTYRSDIASIRESGGGLPQFQTIKAPQISEGQHVARAVPLLTSKRTLLISISVLFLIVLALAGYFAYTAFFKNTSESQGIPSAVNSASSSSEENSPVPQQLVHVSAFRKPVDQKLTLVLSGVATNASGLQTYSQKLQSVLSTSDLTAKFVEVEARGDNAKSLSLNDVFTAAGTFVIDRDFLAQHFNPDLTIFAYREGGEFWPGYILTLNPDEIRFSLQSEVAKLEASPNVPNFFLNPPDGQGEFYDGKIGNQEVRMADFATGTRFVYGWIDGKLIFSTSYVGFSEAIARL